LEEERGEYRSAKKREMGTLRGGGQKIRLQESMSGQNPAPVLWSGSFEFGGGTGGKRKTVSGPRMTEGGKRHRGKFPILLSGPFKGGKKKEPAKTHGQREVRKKVGNNN